MNSLYRKYRDHGVIILGIASRRTDPEKLKRWLSAHPVEFPVLVDQGAETYERFMAWSKEGMDSPFPFEVLIDRSGRIQAAFRNYRPDVLEAAFMR